MDSHRASVCSELDMKIILLLLASTSLCWASPLTEHVPLQLSYHSAVGVPLAERLRAAEARGARTRVAGGVPANPADFPYFAGLLIELDIGATSVCGATLVSRRRLLTAAHCWWDGRVQGRRLTAVLASDRLFSGGVRLTSDTVEMHQSYNPQNLNNDMAAISVDDVTLSDAIQPVTLPSGFLLYLTYEGNQVQIVGYGVSNDDENITTGQSLNRVTAMVVNNLDCQTVYGFNVIDSTICTSGQGRVGPCGGDSGGPLVTLISGAHVLIGVTSFHAAGGCHIGFPGGYARVTSFVSWINARL